MAITKKELEDGSVVYVCDRCGEEFEDEDDLTPTANGDYVCESCRDDYYVSCSECGEYVDVDDEVFLEDGDRWVCVDCLEYSDKYFQCSDCDQWFMKRYTDCYETVDGRTICEDCADNNYERCGECDDLFRTDDLSWSDRDDCYYCDRCLRDKHKIKDYGYKPSPVFKSTHDVFYDRYTGDDLMFGVELEVDHGNGDPEELASDLLDISDDIYCKHDGSLDEGVEIVTHPATLDYHMNSLGWGKILDTCLDAGYVSHNAKTCGLHVHVGRRQLGKTDGERDETIEKILVLVNRHCERT